MLSIVGSEHRMISEAAGGLLGDLARRDAECQLGTHRRIAAGEVRNGLAALGLLADLSPEAPAASSLVQVLIAIEAGRTALPFQILETLAAAFVLCHAGGAAAGGIDLARTVVTQASLPAGGRGLPRRRGGRISALAEAVPFAAADALLLLPLRPGRTRPQDAALVLIGLDPSVRIARSSVEDDYPVADVVLADRRLADAVVLRANPGGRDLVGVLALHNSLLAAAEIAGAGRRALEMTRQYLLARTQFGRPLGANQALKHRMAQHFVRVEALEMMLRYAAAALDAGAEDAPAAVHAAKIFAGRTGRSLAEDMLQMHGAIGYTTEYPLHLFMRRIFRLTASYGSTYRQGEMLFEEFERRVVRA